VLGVGIGVWALWVKQTLAYIGCRQLVWALPCLAIVLELFDVASNNDDHIEMDRNEENDKHGRDDLHSRRDVCCAVVKGDIPVGVLVNAVARDVLLGIDRVEREPGGCAGRKEDQPAHERVEFHKTAVSRNRADEAEERSKCYECE